MSNVNTSTTIAPPHDDQHTFDKKAIWKTFRILLYITIVELVLAVGDRKSTRLNSSHPSISYAVFCLKKKLYHVPVRRHGCSGRQRHVVIYRVPCQPMAYLGRAVGLCRCVRAHVVSGQAGL